MCNTAVVDTCMQYFSMESNSSLVPWILHDIFIIFYTCPAIVHFPASYGKDMYNLCLRSSTACCDLPAVVCFLPTPISIAFVYTVANVEGLIL